MKSLLRIAGLFLIVGSTLFIMHSCESEIKGCTDPEAIDYNPDATTSSGTCTYARDKFIGTFLGSVACPQLATVSSDSLVFSIEEKPSGNNDVRLLLTLSGLPFILDGSVNGDVLSVAADLKKVPYSFGGFTIEVDVIATGTATIDAAGKIITGALSVTLKYSESGATLASDNCTITGVKQ